MSLDDALAAWAASVQLSPTAAEEIYQRIVRTPAPAHTPPARLDPSWWRRFNSDFTNRIIISTKPTAWAA
ncbi:MAG TPA: hypothetical protein VH641_03035 [Streptosporangiaceae bacterium]|jgi:hypothetical protein